MAHARPQKTQPISIRYEARPVLLARRVTLSRQRRHLGVRALVRQSGVPWRAVARILKGESEDPSLWTVARLATALGVSLDYLAGLTTYNGKASVEAQEVGRAGYIPTF
jgi:transcriptional regulator with XRE-family HTH domain